MGTRNTGERVVTLSAAQIAQHPENLRNAGREIDRLAKSIAEVGVLVPLIVVPVEAIDGHEWPEGITHVAVDGNRRAAAAAQVGAPLPCIVRTEVAHARDMVVTMAVTTLAREGLTPAEEVRAVQTMLDLGLSQTTIAKATGRKPAQVRAAKQAATLPDETLTAADKHDLGLDDLAVIAEFDDPEAQAALMDAAKAGTLEHTAARLRRDSAAKAAYSGRLAELQADGIAVTNQAPDYDGQAPRRVTELNNKRGNAYTPQTHATCPGHAIYLRQGTWDPDPIETAVCLDYRAHGHVDRYANTPGHRANGPMTDQQKAERAQLIRRNKQMAAAQDVRIAFVKSLIGTRNRTTAKTQTAWLLHRLLHRDRTYARFLAEWSESKTLTRLLGENADRQCRNAAPDRHPTLAWAQMCAAQEDEWTKDVWRHPDDNRCAYLRHLVSLGYRPCEVEQYMIDTHAAREAKVKAKAKAKAKAETDDDLADNPGDDPEQQQAANE